MTNPLFVLEYTVMVIECEGSGEIGKMEKLPSGTETILIVDDQETVWEFLIEALQKLGYSVLLAENGPLRALILAIAVLIFILINGMMSKNSAQSNEEEIEE